MKRTFLLKTMLLLCALVAGSSSVWGQSNYSATYTSNVTLPTSGTNMSSCKVVINNTEYDGVKLGKSGSGGSTTITAPQGTKYIHLHIAAWNTKSAGFNYKVGNATAVTISGITSNSGIANNSPFTFSGNASSSDYYKIITLETALESNTTITLASTSERVVFWGVNTEEEETSLTKVNIVSFTAETTTLVLGGTTTTTTTVTNDQAGWTPSYSYASDDATVATVDANGVITAVAKGTANITVTPNVLANDPTYKAGDSKSIEITVKNPSHTATFSVNGVTSEESVEEGDAITFPANPAAINGKSFVGWVTEAINGSTDTAPTFVTSPTMGTTNVTYYAVFADAEGSGEETITYEKLSSNEFDADATYVIGSMNGNNLALFYSYGNTVDSEASWGMMSTDYTNNPPLTFTLSGTASALYVKDNNGNYLQGKVNDFRMVSETNKSAITLAEDGSLHDIQSANSTERWLRYNTTANCGLRWYATTKTTGNLAYFYKRIVNPGYTYSGYCTSITATITLASACTDGSLYYGTYSNGTAFVVPSDLIVSEISVIDGQLVILDYDTDDVVPANTGVLVVSDVAGDHTVTLTTEAGTSKLGDDNMLKPSGDNGVTASDMADTDYYYYRLTMYEGKPGFWWKSDNGAGFALAANKAYLKVLKSNAGTVTSQASGFTLGDHETTGVNDVRSKTEEVRGEYFNLAGQRVAQPTKGLYIVNGRKVVIK